MKNIKNIKNIKKYLKTGDILVISFAVMFLIYITFLTWNKGKIIPDKAVIYVKGKVFQNVNLYEDKHKIFTINGELGETQIEILNGKIRIKSDNSNKQICVKQGWISKVGEIAICAPNQISVKIEGRSNIYDSIVY